MRAIRFFLLPAAALLAACDGTGATEPAGCPPVVLPALEVQVVDAATGASVAAEARGFWVASDDRTGELDHHPVMPESGLYLYGASGRYSIVVEHPGYAVWGRDDVRVDEDECGPVTTRIRAELVATP